MRIIPLHQESDSDYSCIVYWILGDRNESGDRNTLVDTGSTNLSNLGYYMREMASQSKGIGKMAIEQVLLTHSHYDHAGGLKGVVRQFNPLLYSWIAVAGKYENTTDNMHVRVGDEDAVIMHTPGHSDDSICIYLPLSGTLLPAFLPTVARKARRVERAGHLPRSRRAHQNGCRGFHQKLPRSRKPLPCTVLTD